MRSLAGLLALALVGGIVACSGSDDDPTGRAWQLTNLEGAPPLEGTIVDLTIQDGQISGSAGCNNYNGAATLDVADNSLTIGAEIASTAMACEEPIMEQETAYLTALPRVTSYEMANDTLTLLDANGVAIATFE